ncbi:MAG TPA: pilin [Rudaea sp.]|nr:pilin [Rudaea sp.]
MRQCAAAVRRVAALAVVVPIAASAMVAETPSTADAQMHAVAIANALSAAAKVQAAVIAYRQHHKEFPSSNQEAAIKPPAAFMTADVKGITVRDAGVVEVTLTGSSGVDDGSIVLTPTLANDPDSLKIDWTCASPSYATIADITGGVCEYTKQP